MYTPNLCIACSWIECNCCTCIVDMYNVHIIQHLKFEFWRLIWNFSTQDKVYVSRLAGLMAAGVDTLSVESSIRGHHVYKDTWTPVSGQVLDTRQEHGNAHDQYAVSVLHHGLVVGHIPRELSHTAWHFLQHRGTITCEVTGRRRLSGVPGKGLEVPCRYVFQGKPSMIRKLTKLIA